MKSYTSKSWMNEQTKQRIVYKSIKKRINHVFWSKITNKRNHEHCYFYYYVLKITISFHVPCNLLLFFVHLVWNAFLCLSLTLEGKSHTELTLGTKSKRIGNHKAKNVIAKARDWNRNSLANHRNENQQSGGQKKG